MRLGMTQAKMALPLGITVRALQSYEQGWRPVPHHVWEKTALLLLLDWRKENRKAAQLCWRVRGCTRQERKMCPAAAFGAGDLCWLLCGLNGGPKRAKRRKSDAPCWMDCPVTRPWAEE
jgi:hypothetical protein